MSTNPIDPPVAEFPSPVEVASEVTLHFDFPRSDIVLRSRDSHNFHVSKLYISNSSPVIRELIQAVSESDVSDVASGEEPESLPVVKLPDRGATLRSLLTFIFPVVPSLPSTSDEIMELLAVAQKYQMDSVLSHLRGIISRQHPPFFRPETALHLYFLVQKLGLHQEAVQAARVTLRLPMVIEDLGDMLGFSDTTGTYLYELWKYHQRIRTDIKSGVPGFRMSRFPEGMKALRCTIPGYFDNPFPQWLDNYIESIAGAPHHLFNYIEFDNGWARHIKEIVAPYYRTCSCIDISGQLRHAFWEALTGFVDEVIERADSSLTLVKEEEIPQNSDPSFVPLLLEIPDASIIVRSSDQVNFRVHKSVLAMNSPFFKDLLSLPQPPDDELVDGLPVVQLPEDASLLSCLFSLLYRPQRPVKPGSYEKVFALLAACQKYDMELIQLDIRDKAERGTFPAPVEAQAFSAYALASSLGLIPEMDRAARLTLGQPMTFESLGEGLRSFKGQALCELVRYRSNK